MQVTTPTGARTARVEMSPPGARGVVRATWGGTDLWATCRKSRE